MKKVFTEQTLAGLRYLSWPALSADGRWGAWVESRGDEKSGLFLSEIHLYDREKQCETDFAAEKGVRKQPVFIPGDRMLYLADTDGQWQLYCVDLHTMETKKLTSARHGVLRFGTSADGSHIAFEAVLWPEEVRQGMAFTEMTEAERQAWEQKLDMQPYYVTELTYKMNQWHGMRKGEYSRLCTVTLSGEQQVIDIRGIEASWPQVSHDGRMIAFYGYPHDGAKGRQPELMVCGFDGSGQRVLTDTIGIYDDHMPQFTPDDTAVICGVYPAYADGSTILLPCKVNLADGKTELLLETTGETVCHGLHCMVANRTEYGDAAQYFLLDETGHYLYFQSSFQGYSSLYRLAMEKDAQPEIVVRGADDIQAFAMTPDGEALWYLMADGKRPAELFENGRQITNVHDWLDEYALGEVEECWCTARDGHTRLEYFLVYPAAYVKGQTYPTVLYAKGGPETMYAKSFWHQFQALASHGFAVVCPNPRGSVGFGRDFCANAVCWKNEAMEDHLDVLNDVVLRGIADPKRLGVTGGSYGGYMTNKLIGRTDLFAAAVSQRSLVNPVTSYGTGDMGFISSGLVDKHFKMMDFLIDRARGNIISYVDQMKTPLLILHSFDDYRCSFEQAEQLFIAMKERNPEVPLRLVAFPKENHDLTRTGKLYHQQRHVKELLDWFIRYLGEEGGEA